MKIYTTFFIALIMTFFCSFSFSQTSYSYTLEDKKLINTFNHKALDIIQQKPYLKNILIEELKKIQANIISERPDYLVTELINYWHGRANLDLFNRRFEKKCIDSIDTCKITRDNEMSGTITEQKFYSDFDGNDSIQV